MNVIEYLILKIAEEKDKFNLDSSDNGELIDNILSLERKGYIKNMGHSNNKGIWEYTITDEGRQALTNYKLGI